MTNENTSETEAATSESIGDYHRMAARHFAAAAKHHLAAATADDDGDNDTSTLPDARDTDPAKAVRSCASRPMRLNCSSTRLHATPSPTG